MKTRAAILLLSSSLLSCPTFGQEKTGISAPEAACGPREVRFNVTADKSQHPTPTLENGKALIYVYQGSGGSTRIGVDGKWLGGLRPGGYLFASIDPGEHHLCAVAHIGLWNHVSLQHLNAKAGETYYFVAHVVGGVVSDEFAISQWDPDEGKYLVAKAKLNVSHPK